MRITIQPYRLALNKDDNGKYFVYTSKYEISFDEDVSSGKLAESLFKYGIFDTSKTPVNTKKSPNGNTYTMICNGGDTLVWMGQLVNWIRHSEFSQFTKISLEKAILKNNEIQDLSSTIPNLNNKMQDMIIDSYLSTVYSIMCSLGMENVIVTKIKKCNNGIKLATYFDKLYIL